MGNHTKNNKQKTIIRKIIIAASLFFFWLSLTLWYIVIFDKSALVLSHNHGEENFTNITHSKLLEGDKLSGEFMAVEDNLGIVALRFKSFQRIPYDQEDTLVFRIKEKGKGDWYYENKYRSGLTYDVPFLPFGFPVISDSKGKTYQFELESLNGNNVNGVALSERQPFLTSKYQKNKAVLFNNPDELVDFALKKFFNSFDTIDITYSSFVFSLPLVFYLFWISPIKSYTDYRSLVYAKNRRALPKNKIHSRAHILFLGVVEKIIAYIPLFIVIGVVLVDILFLQILNDLLYISTTLLWLSLFRAYRLDSKYSFLVGLFLLSFSPLFLELNIANVAEKAAAWAFIFFVAGLIQAMIELRKSS